MKKDASRFSPKGVLFHRTFFTAPFFILLICGQVHIYIGMVDHDWW